MGFELQAVTKVIDGKEFSVTPLGAVTGRKALTRLIKVVGPAVEHKSIAELASNLQEADVDYFCDLFAKNTRVTMGTAPNGSPIQPLLSDSGNFDLLFAANYGTMLSWLKLCFEANFSSFFQSLGSALTASPMKTESK